MYKLQRLPYTFVSYACFTWLRYMYARVSYNLKRDSGGQFVEAALMFVSYGMPHMHALCVRGIHSLCVRGMHALCVCLMCTQYACLLCMRYSCLMCMRHACLMCTRHACLACMRYMYVWVSYNLYRDSGGFSLACWYPLSLKPMTCHTYKADIQGRNIRQPYTADSRTADTCRIHVAYI